LNIAVGIVGALVMPHNIFLHSALVQSRKIDMNHTGAKREAILYNAIESGFSLSVTVVINLFVMAVFAAGFHGRDHRIPEVGLLTAGKCALLLLHLLLCYALV
jgi:natural resistance-associated macrophage protein 2